MKFSTMESQDPTQPRPTEIRGVSPKVESPSPGGVDPWSEPPTLSYSPLSLARDFWNHWRTDQGAGGRSGKLARSSLEEIKIHRRSADVCLFHWPSDAAEKTSPSYSSNQGSPLHRWQPARMLHPELTNAHRFDIIGAECQLKVRIRGTPPDSFREQLQTLCEEADAVVTKPFLTESELTRRLEELVRPFLPPPEPSNKPRFWNLLNVSLMLFLAGVALLTAAGVQHYRWQQRVAQIDASPGIEVISHSNRWGRFRLDVLRDPLSPPLVTVLQSLGMEPHDLDLRERPFVSGEPLFVAKRAMSQSDPAATQSENEAAAEVTAQIASQARNEARLDMVRALMELPPDLKLTLTDDRLTAVGTLSEPAYTKLQQAPRRISWLRSVDLSQVRDLTSENIVMLKEGIEKIPVEFIPSASILPEASQLRLQSLGSELKLLSDEVNLKKQGVRLQVQANHPDIDPLTLARRIETLIRDLTRIGMPGKWYDATAGLLDSSGPNTITLRLTLVPLESEP